MDYGMVQPIVELISGVGFPAAVVLILLYIHYKQGKKFTEAMHQSTAAVKSLESTVMILSERLRNS
jgi:hypothetical protein